MKKFIFYITPFFLAKLYLLKDIQWIIRKYHFSGRLLDIGCGEKPYKDLFKNVNEYQGIDFENFSANKDFYGENPDYFFVNNYLETLALPFPDESFDHCVSFQVMEHHKNPQKLVSEIIRITKPGGYLLLTVPFLGGIHEEPHDYQRFTKYGLKELFKGKNCQILELKNQGSLFSTISLLFSEYLNNIAYQSKLKYFLCMFIYPPFSLFQYLCLVLDQIFKSDKIFFNYIILVQIKKSTLS